MARHRISPPSRAALGDKSEKVAGVLAKACEYYGIFLYLLAGARIHARTPLATPRLLVRQRDGRAGKTL